MTITVSIGRNIGTARGQTNPGTPLSDDLWASYMGEVTNIILRHGFDIVFSGVGTGVDPGTQEREESFTLVAIPREGHGTMGLYRALERLAADYLQDSIALTAGQTSFPGTHLEA